MILTFLKIKSVAMPCDFITIVVYDEFFLKRVPSPFIWGPLPFEKSKVIDLPPLVSRQPGRLSTHPPSKEITPKRICWRKWSINLVFWAGVILWTAVETPKKKVWLFYVFEIGQTATYQLKFLVMQLQHNSLILHI